MAKPILVCTFVALVILTECLFAWFLIPSTTDVQAWAKTQAQQTAHGDSHAGGQTSKQGEASHGGSAENHEVEAELGRYNVVIHQPAANLTMRVNFHLIGTLPEAEEAEFNALLAKNEHRLRDQVIFEIRNSRVDDLTDPGLALLKRKILAKSNELLGKPILRTVLFSDFSFIEQ
ncbi:MAG TPA: flagellar basal body-associated FliL family protein [Pirellulaceae bacterium]|nr:flagellar basal body-associated FliL family protein [Pirellulaceae bacterium]